MHRRLQRLDDEHLVPPIPRAMTFSRFELIAIAAVSGFVLLVNKVVIGGSATGRVPSSA